VREILAVGIVAGGARRSAARRDQKSMTIAPVAIRFPIIMIPPMSRILAAGIERQGARVQNRGKMGC